MNKTDEIYN